MRYITSFDKFFQPNLIKLPILFNKFSHLYFLLFALFFILLFLYYFLVFPLFKKPVEFSLINYKFRFSNFINRRCLTATGTWIFCSFCNLYLFIFFCVSLFISYILGNIFLSSSMSGSKPCGSLVFNGKMFKKFCTASYVLKLRDLHHSVKL